jgi:hypothetical protein
MTQHADKKGSSAVRGAGCPDSMSPCNWRRVQIRVAKGSNCCTRVNYCALRYCEAKHLPADDPGIYWWPTRLLSGLLRLSVSSTTFHALSIHGTTSFECVVKQRHVERRYSSSSACQQRQRSTESSAMTNPQRQTITW